MSKARNMARMGQDTSAGYTGAFDMPAGTTAERPASAGLGWTRLNTDTGSVEVYDGTNWNAVTRPFISSVTGSIYAGAASNLVIAGQNFTSTITVRFLEGGSTVADVTGVSVSAGSATVAVPAAVYGQTVGDSIEVKVINSDGTISANGITKTVQALPTGGTIVSSGGYRYHTFTSSSNFVVPSGFSATAEYLIVAGGGGGGTGGGGAGGLISGSASVSANTYSIVVGAGGAASNSSPVSGSNSTGLSQTAIGGGAGGRDSVTAPSGGSGGGGHGGWSPAAAGGGSGTSGQGNAGGNGAGVSTSYACGGGGGGKGAAGANGTSSAAGNGGAGTNTYSTWASATSSGASGYYAGGGGGGGYAPTNNNGGSGGAGGGGNGGGLNNSSIATAGTTNTGGGGGGTYGDALGNGASGIVIIRYAV